MSNFIRIATRKSPLALVQANRVKELIEKRLKDTKVKLITRSTSGDTVSKTEFKKSGGKGLFLKELEELLLDGDADIAVHSLKDMDSEETKGLTIHAYLERNDARETFVSKSFNKISDIKEGKIGSSSKRRELQIKLLNKDIKVESIRGNVDTRIEKIEKGEYDGVILALAGLKTLNLKNHIKQIFSLKEFIPTAGQGIIAVQCRENDEDTKKILKKINHINTEICALAERSFLKTLGGDCDTAVGCSAVLKGNNIDLEAQLFSDDGKEVYNVIKSGESTDPKRLGKIVGEEILKKAGKNFVKKR